MMECNATHQLPWLLVTAHGLGSLTLVYTQIQKYKKSGPSVHWLKQEGVGHTEGKLGNV